MRSLNRSELFAKPEVKRTIFEIREALKAALPEGAFADREAAAMAISDEAVRGLLEDDLQALADGLGDLVLVDGVAYKEHEPGTDKYHSLCGPLKVRRSSFRKTGMHNGPIAIALELAAGIIEGATPALAYNIAHGYAQHDMRLHEESLRAAFRLPPARSTLERLAQRIGQSAIEHAPSIERALRRGEGIPEGSVAVVLGLDRTSVPMVEDRPEDAPPKPEPKRRKPRIRRAPAPFDINWRMAYVGTISFVDADGEMLHAIRYASPACDDPREVVEKMTADLRAALKRDSGLNVGIVQDGAPEMWNRTREGLESLRKDGLLTTWHEGIDRYHLLERLAAALEVIEPDAVARKRKLDEWREGFDAQDATIDNVERFFIRHYNALAGAQREALWEQLRYIGNNKDRMRYVALRLAALPVGSGVTESTAKTVIGQRAKGAGQRWRESGLRAALTLRALDQSDRLPRFCSRLSRHYVANVEAA
jgi:hypothetical protein